VGHHFWGVNQWNVTHVSVGMAFNLLTWNMWRYQNV